MPENIPLVLSSRKDEMHETEKTADWDSKRAHQVGDRGGGYQ